MYETRSISVDLHLKVDGNPVHIVGITSSHKWYPKLAELEALSEDGTRFPLECAENDDGMRLSDYAYHVSNHFGEWFMSLYREQNETHRTEYQFDDDGSEYWYEETDFRKHYTREEG